MTHLDTLTASVIRGKLYGGLEAEEVAGLVVMTGLERVWKQADWVMVIRVEQSIEQVVMEDMFQAAVVKGLYGGMD